MEVVVGPDGAEQFGVRKKHIIRGTRYPLPKPKVRAGSVSCFLCFWLCSSPSLYYVLYVAFHTLQMPF